MEFFFSLFFHVDSLANFGGVYVGFGTVGCGVLFLSNIVKRRSSGLRFLVVVFVLWFVGKC